MPRCRRTDWAASPVDVAEVVDGDVGRHQRQVPLRWYAVVGGPGHTAAHRDLVFGVRELLGAFIGC